MAVEAGACSEPMYEGIFRPGFDTTRYGNFRKREVQI